MSQRIDHVVIHVGPQLDEAAAQYARLGFRLTPRGHHSLGSSNHLAVFGDDYLELLGVEPANAERPGARWEHPLGLVGLVFKTDDADRTWNDLARRGVPRDSDGPRAFHRPVELADGTRQDAAFRTVRIAAGQVPNGRVFFCQHLTPGLVWRPEWQGHPNGATGLAEYVYASPDPRTSARLLAQAFGVERLTDHPRGARFQAGPVSVLYLTPEGVAEHYGAPIPQLPDGTARAVGLTLRSVSLERTRATLRANRIAATESGGRIVVSAEQAQGVILAFTQA